MDHLDSPTQGSEPRLGRSISLEHAAKILGVSRRTIYNRIREGRLQTIRTLGGSQRVLLDDDLRQLTQTIRSAQISTVGSSVE